MNENLGGRVLLFLGILCLPLDGIGLKDLTKWGPIFPLSPSVPTTLYGKTTIKFD